MKGSKRWLSCFLIVIMLICSIDIGFAVNEEVSDSVNMSFEEETTFYSEESKINVLEDIEAEPSETDNWELNLVFYDSTVNGGTTPLTEINWDASDGGYGTGETRVITVQINYRNTNCIKTYQPGELEIWISNLAYNASENTDNSPFWETTITIGANDSTHIGYDWNFVSETSPSNTQETYRFQNANIIEKGFNFEGSIQIIYEISPKSEYDKLKDIYPEEYLDNCKHSYTKGLSATLNNITSSNEINLTYFREYVHPWKRKEYKMTKTASKISSYDGLGVNASDYIWVKYGFYHTDNFGNFINTYQYIYANNGFYKDKLPEKCIVYDINQNLLTADENGYYLIKEIKPAGDSYSYIFVGYPKSIYNEENNNLNITNEVELWGTYQDRTESELLNTASINLNLGERVGNPR